MDHHLQSLQDLLLVIPLFTIEGDIWFLIFLDQPHHHFWQRQHDRCACHVTPTAPPNFGWKLMH